MRPLLLLSNDDGYQAAGLTHLIQTLRPLADLLVVAPDGPRSGFANKITISEPLYNRLVRQEEASAQQGSLLLYACSGSPVDCVKLAFNILLPRLGRQAAMVCSGVNHGDNSSINAFYSGTLGAAAEGCIQGVPGVGFSLCDHSSQADFSPTTAIIVQVVERVLREGLPPEAVLNVNFPLVPEYRGVRMCRMARSRWVKEMAEQHRPITGMPYYWMTGEPLDLEPDAPDTDRYALAQGYVAITPHTIDTTHPTLLHTWQWTE